MTEPLLIALITLASVVVGNILTFIPAWIQGNREKIKFQKEIYDSRLLKIEKHLEEYQQKLESVADSKLPCDIIMTLDFSILYSSQITNDYFINQAVNKLVTLNIDFLREADLVEQGTKQKTILRYSSFDIKEACSQLITAIDEFKLNDYKPRKRQLRIIISDWDKQRKQRK